MSWKMCSSDVSRSSLVFLKGEILTLKSLSAYTIIEAGVRIGKGTVVGENCKVCAGVEIGEGMVVEDDTVVYGSGWGGRRKEKKGLGLDGLRKTWVDLQGDTLRRMWTGK